VVQSIIAAEVGYHELALRYFWDGAFVDVGNLHGNTADGVHVASAGGVWSALVFGFGGLRDHGSVLHFDPRLPDQWPSLTFRLTQRGTRVKVTVRRESIAFDVEVGPGLTVDVRGTLHNILAHAQVVVPLEDQGPRIDGVPDPEKYHGTLRAGGTMVTASLPVLVNEPDVEDAEMDPTQTMS
jgi:alpha,alpha-trehalose phosphorylase